jgi:hypothetical protein
MGTEIPIKNWDNWAVVINGFAVVHLYPRMEAK